MARWAFARTLEAIGGTLTPDPAKEQEQPSSISAADAKVLELHERTARQYEEYLRLNTIVELSALAVRETWMHDPRAPLSLELDKPK